MAEPKRFSSSGDISGRRCCPRSKDSLHERRPREALSSPRNCAHHHTWHNRQFPFLVPNTRREGIILNPEWKTWSAYISSEEVLRKGKHLCWVTKETNEHCPHETHCETLCSSMLSSPHDTPQEPCTSQLA